MTRLVRYNLYLNPEWDGALITWLAGQKNASQAIRDCLSRSLAAEGAPLSPVNIEAVRDAVLRSLDERNLNLGAIRRIVEAALRDAPAVGAGAGDAPDEDESWLNDLIVE